MSLPHSIRQRHRRLLALTVALLCASALHAERLVVGIGTGEKSYLEARKSQGANRRETYVFMPGNYLVGMTHDNSLEKMPFRQIAETLAPDLVRQNYHPAEAVNQADLLLVVHWGVTSRVDRDIADNLTNLNTINELAEQYDQSMQAEAEAVQAGGATSESMGVNMGLSSGLRSDLEAQASHETMNYRAGQSEFHGVGRDNAAILGVANVLSAENNHILFSERYRTLFEMTREERYFIVVMAYDMPGLLKTGKLRRLWTARASIRSAGVNFGMAVARISQVAGGFFGENTDGVVLKKSGVREGTVTLGELKIIGVEKQ